MDEANFGKNLTLSLVFFTFTPIVIGISLFSLIFLRQSPVYLGSVKGTSTEYTNSDFQSGAQLYASLPDTFPTVSESYESADARVEIIRQYLTSYNSPLVGHADELVAEADKNELDWRLLTAIAQQESNLCKRIIPSTYNCWGWGIHSQGTLGFSSFSEGISVVSKGLKENYIDQGRVTVDQIMDKWVPHSPERAWAKAVNSFLLELQ